MKKLVLLLCTSLYIFASIAFPVGAGARAMDETIIRPQAHTIYSPCGKFSSLSSTQYLADLILKCSSHIKFQLPEERKAFLKVRDTGGQVNPPGKHSYCGKFVTINADLLRTLLMMTKKYRMVIGVFAAGHDCDKLQHPRGLAVDINGVTNKITGVTTGNNNRLRYNLTPPKMAMLRQFYTDLAHESKTQHRAGGMLRQINCFGSKRPQSVPGIKYDIDSCDHLHLELN